MTEPSLDDIAGELYALPPEAFTAARNARAAEASDRALAAAIKALRKPPVAAWVVNLLVRRGPDELGQALALAEELRAAQEDRDAAALTRLGRERRTLVGALVRQAGDLARAEGIAVSASVADDVEKTLTAAMLDASAADALMTARLTRPLEAVGFGGIDLDGAVAGSVTARAPNPSRDHADATDAGRTAAGRDELAERRARKAAERALREAEQADADAQRALTRTETKWEKARERASLVEERAAKLRRELDRVEEELAEAEAELARLDEDREAAASAARDTAETARAARAATQADD